MTTPQEEPRPGRVKRYARFLAKRISGLYFRDIIRNQQEILRLQQGLSTQLESLSSSVQVSRHTAYLGEHKLLTKLPDGHKIYLDSRDIGLTPHLVCDGYWEPGMTVVWNRTVLPGMTVIDVGANVGYYTLLANQLVGATGCVVAFEPDPSTFELLTSSVDINGYRSRCVCVQKAVAAEPGRATLYRRSKYQINTSLMDASAWAATLLDSVTEFDVDLTSLDTFAREDLGGRAVDLVKIDAEGAETMVLAGMQDIMARNREIVVLCEFNAERVRIAGGDPLVALDLLRQADFDLRYIESDGTICPITSEAVLNGPEITLFLKRV